MRNETLLQFLKRESAIGVLLIVSTVMALAMANSPLHSFYSYFLSIPVVISFDEFAIAKPLLLWINDGLMAVFFFMVGLEIKREVLEGSLQERSKVALPAFAAIGGMLVPALIYGMLNAGDEGAMKGWAIPMATDIAFALGILSLLGSRVPPALKVFLLALAIIDDLGAIIVIALFYGHGLSLAALGTAMTMALILLFMNLRGVTNNTFYILIGLIMWAAVLKSGVHATIAGVVLGLLIPLRGNRESFHDLEHSLHAPVNYIILPLFAFVNTGVSFGSVSASDFMHSVTVGIAAGLFFGKSIGIFLFSRLAVALRLGQLPEGVTNAQLFGVAILGGIGFTMSLFIGSLAFECSEGICFSLVDERIGILMGSLVSGVVGALYLSAVLKKTKQEETPEG
ncbi:Na+/H+ antiporter NhaA [Sulfurimonas sp. HSL-3221]|uniref:Na+/H+ antiporter NhaA n=1 Tax=Sulfurimonadaceae TaxID=2771471 RepID=UPI001E5C648E|nr:Na+/H+ antiporter NhaA [Sulfurimonas sp. HSL-3221]UFS62322.1 Na+/H+ antiporter NhaA [Sulfurimonas sp. HSL-3221]